MFYMHGANALEYLMVYGWAIIIIVIVLGALYMLGIFSGTGSPRAQPGSCVVLRPNGIGTTQFISLSGTCSGELPDYVAQFNGQSSNVLLPVMFSATKACGVTITAWFLDQGMPNSTKGGVVGIFSNMPHLTSEPFDIETNDTVLRFEAHNTINPNSWTVSGSYKGTWTFVALVLNNGVLASYVNGVQAGTPTISNIGCLTLDNNGIIGEWDTYFNGDISNVQIYSTGFTAAGIKALYIEGIGGAPTNLPSLVAWYPLNGNAGDYGGNNYAGIAKGLSYDTQWAATYMPP